MTRISFATKKSFDTSKGRRKMELRKINLQDVKAQWEYKNDVLPTLISYEHPVNMPDCRDILLSLG